MTNKASRSHSIDFIKGIAAISVVCLHCANKDAFDSFTHLVGHLAVPVFFIITGYYLPSMIKSGTITKQIRKIIRIIFGGLLFYLSLYCIDAALRGNLQEWLSQVVSWDILGLQLVLGQFPFNVRAGHLWYLVAILYILCFMFLYTSKRPVKKLYVLIPVLFLISYIIASMDYDRELRGYYQNFLFTGFPYVLLGSYIREQGTGKQLGNKQLLGLMALFALLYLAEIGLYNYTGLPVHREHYLMIIPLVATILIWASKNPQFGSKSIITTIGREYSTYIYVIHLYFVEKMWVFFHETAIDSKLHMLTSIALSILFSFLYVLIKRTWRKYHHR